MAGQTFKEFNAACLAAIMAMVPSQSATAQTPHTGSGEDHGAETSSAVTIDKTVSAEVALKRAQEALACERWEEALAYAKVVGIQLQYKRHEKYDGLLLDACRVSEAVRRAVADRQPSPLNLS